MFGVVDLMTDIGPKRLAALILHLAIKIEEVRAALELFPQSLSAPRRRRRFERRLYRHWKPLIDVLDEFLYYSTEFGMGVNRRGRTAAVAENDLVFQVLVQSHARSCLIASEARALIVSGHASGAMTRWRSIHELVVVASFIKQHGQDVANRYLLHAEISSYKLARQYQEHQGDLNLQPITDEEYADIRRRRDVLVEAFGKSFNGDYGWAAGVLPGNPNFDQLEQAVGIAHWRPYYRMASDSVHAGPKGSLFDIGKLGIEGAEKLMLAGPSQAGLVDPIQSVIITMMHMNTILVNYRVDLKSVSQMRMAMKLHDKARKLVENWVDLKSPSA